MLDIPLGLLVLDRDRLFLRGDECQSSLLAQGNVYTLRHLWRENRLGHVSVLRCLPKLIENFLRFAAQGRLHHYLLSLIDLVWSQNFTRWRPKEHRLDRWIFIHERRVLAFFDFDLTTIVNCGLILISEVQYVLLGSWVRAVKQIIPSSILNGHVSIEGWSMHSWLIMAGSWHHSGVVMYALGGNRATLILQSLVELQAFLHLILLRRCCHGCLFETHRSHWGRVLHNLVELPCHYSCCLWLSRHDLRVYHPRLIVTTLPFARWRQDHLTGVLFELHRSLTLIALIRVELLG